MCWGGEGEVWGVWGKVRGDGGVKKCEGRCGRVYGESVLGCISKLRGEVWGVWGKVRRDVGCVKKCWGISEKVNGVSVESVGNWAGVWGGRERCWGT